jgi:hypothetical protein
MAIAALNWIKSLSAPVAWFGMILGMGMSLSVSAHEIRPASLVITERSAESYDVVWKQPVVGTMAIHLVPHLSSGALDRAPDQFIAAPGFLIKSWSISGGAALDGQTVIIEGLEHTVTDTLLRVNSLDGREINAVIRPSAPEFLLSLSGPKGVAVPAYLALGVEHILTGADHLMFVFGLLLLVGIKWRIAGVVTAFTLAHSITLALAALGYIHVEPSVVEALVALSIIFVAAELIPRPGKPPTLTQRQPWLIAFAFGLLHGLAFAGALAEVGLPKDAALFALFTFNLGVELGQLIFVVAAIGAIMVLRRIPMFAAGSLHHRLAQVPAYGIGAAASYWFIERMVAVYF